MRIRELLGRSLRVRLLAGMGIMLLPIAMLAAAAIFAVQGALVALDDIAHEASQELALVMRLQVLAQRVSILVHDFRISGPSDVGRRQLFLQASQQVEAAFGETEGKDFALAEERQHLRTAQSAWAERRRIADSILSIRPPAETEMAESAFARLDAKMDEVLAHLSSRVSLATQDELGQLGKAFNAMAEKLAQTQATLEDLSFHDGLTGLYNYREFQRRLAAEVERSWRYGRQFSLLFLDIDNFKRVNDTFGHLAGDEALRTLAAMVTRAVRPADQLARYGGDEFAIILPETPASGALVAGERIRSSLVSQPIPIGGGREVNCTASIGVATYPEDGESGERLVAVADQALYAAKETGGNRVMRAAPPPLPVETEW